MISMVEFLFFLAGFFSALILIAALFTAGGLWWFFSYGKHLRNRQQAEGQLTKAEQLRRTRKVPMVETEDL